MATYRTGDKPGPDYYCSSCGLRGHRLWRMSASSCVELTCAVCSERDQADEIKRYANLHQPGDPTIGNLVPARRDPEDHHWWGHSGGDVEWWYRMPQYKDEKREAELLRRERDEFLHERDHWAQRWHETSKEAFDLAKRMQERP